VPTSTNNKTTINLPPAKKKNEGEDEGTEERGKLIYQNL
jgi:hypothetical protein